MKYFIKATWIIFLLLFVTACEKNDPNSLYSNSIFRLCETNCDNAGKFDSIIDQISTWTNDHEIVGAEFLVIENQKILVHEVFGWMDKESDKEMQKNTIFRIRSMTKPMIGTLAWMLVEENKLKLSDTVAQFLPSFDNDTSRSITIDQLMTHTTGFQQPGFIFDYDTYDTLKEAVDDIGKHGPSVVPGTQYIYSDANVAILGAIISEITNMPVEDFLQVRVLDPLNMNDTFSTLIDESNIKNRISSTYYRSGNDYIKYWDSSRPQETRYFRASGGLYSTPLDYAHFLYMWMNEGVYGSNQLLSASSINKALKPTDHNIRYGYLWEIGTYFGHGGSDGTIAFAIPSENMMVLYFTQSRSTPTTEMIKIMTLKEFGISMIPHYEKMDVEPDFFDDYVGSFQNDLITLTITTNGESLLLTTADAADQVFYPASIDFFFHESLDVQLSFIRDHNDLVVGIRILQRGESIELPRSK